jgi:multicomponent Na+:H+ antiporter subunit F
LNSLLLGTAAFVLLTVALGLIRILRGPGDTERMMAAQLLGTGGVAVLLLVAVAGGNTALLDVALVLALLAAFASIAFCKGAPGRSARDTSSDSAPHAGDDR